MRTDRTRRARVGIVTGALALALIGCTGQQGQGTTGQTQPTGGDEPAKTATEGGVWVKTKMTTKSTTVGGTAEGDADPMDIQSEDVYEIDEHGNVLSVTSTQSYGNQGATTTKTINTIDDNGYKTSRAMVPQVDDEQSKEAVEREEKFPVEKYENTVDENKRLTHRKTLSREGGTGFMDVFTQVPSETKGELEDPTYADNGSYEEYSYDAEGHLTKVESVHVSKVATEDGQTYAYTNTSVWNYDKNGLLTSSENKAKNEIDGKLEGEEESYGTSVEWEPKNDAHPKKETLTYDTGGTSVTTFEYDENGNVTLSRSEIKGEEIDTVLECTYEWKYIENPSPAARQTAAVFSAGEMS